MVWPSVKAHWKLSEAQYFISADPVRALQANLDAVNAFEYDAKPRRQLALTLATLEANSDVTLKLSPEAADQMYAITATAAPHTPAVLLTRFQHLLLSGRWKERRAETDAIVEELKLNASLHPAVWLAVASYASMTRDEAGLISALHRLRQLDEGMFREIAPKLGVEVKR
jgi:hypothetical protein